MLYPNHELRRISRFVFIGVFATLVHYLTVVYLVQHAHFSPILANPGGFVCAFIISYLGQSLWTFKATLRLSQLKRYFLVSISGFAINQALYRYLLSQKINYQIALLITLLVVATIVYIMQRSWVFAKRAL